MYPWTDGPRSRRSLRFAAALVLSLLLVLPGAVASAEGSTSAAPNASPAPAAAAAANLVLDDLQLTLGPEYDAPSPQVFGDIAGVLVNKGAEPISTTVTVRLPKDGRLNSVCELSADPRTATTDPTHDTLTADQVQVQAIGQDKDGYLEVTWQMKKTIKPGELYPFHVEFYFPGVTGGPDKSLRYVYSPTYEAAGGKVAIAEPKGAENFQANLGQSSDSAGGDGLKYHIYSLPATHPGQPVEVQVTYTRVSNEPSLPPPTQQVSAGGGQSQASGGTNTVPLVIGLLVVFGLAGLFLVSGNPGQGPRGSRRRVVAAAQPQSGSGRGAATRQASPAGRRAGSQAAPRPADARAQARQLLDSGQISQDAYRMIIAQLDAEEGR